MLNVWSLCWGDKYDDYAVQRLRREVAAKLSFPHRFRCVTDRQIEGVECVPPVVKWPGWWGKIQLFKPGFVEPQSVNIWLDLDIIVTGQLDYLAAYSPPLAAPSNWAQSGNGGIQSSVMVWTPTGATAEIFSEFDPKWAVWPPSNANGALWGDQEWITKRRDEGKLAVTPIPYVYSYKYHCRNGLPDDARIVVFHGDPKPSQVRESWFEW